MLYYVYIISYTFFFFFSRTSQGVSRFHCYILCKIVFWRYLSPSSSHFFFFSLSLCARSNVHLFFFPLFFFSDKCHLWFVYKVYVCIIHSYVLHVYMHFIHSFMFYTYTCTYIYVCIYIYAYMYMYRRIYLCMCICVCVCWSVCAHAPDTFIYRVSSLSRRYKLYVHCTSLFIYLFIFFFFCLAVAPRVCVRSDRIHLLSLKYMQRGCHGTPRAVSFTEFAEIHLENSRFFF